VPRDLDVHLAMDNYATHKTPLIRKWLAKRPRWHVHLTPTSSSWLNQVERFFALLTDKKIRRGIYGSVAALTGDIASFIECHNADPKPFRWTKSADDILASVERFCARAMPRGPYRAYRRAFHDCGKKLLTVSRQMNWASQPAMREGGKVTFRHSRF
jgi:hypothetical protein